jgi:hypothetical protein
MEVSTVDGDDGLLRSACSRTVAYVNQTEALSCAYLYQVHVNTRARGLEDNIRKRAGRGT